MNIPFKDSHKVQSNTTKGNKIPENYILKNYNYKLPIETIAQNPTLPLHNAKLLICTKNQEKGYTYKNSQYINLPEILLSHDVLFFNNTKVFKARITLNETPVVRHSGFKTKINGEIFIYKINDNNYFEAIVSDDKNFKPGSKLMLQKHTITIKKFTPDGLLCHYNGKNIFQFLEKYAQLPLPPYIKYSKEKEQRYQTSFAQQEGSAAAPTASLHFTSTLLKKLTEKKIIQEFLTLHVGLGTFRPIISMDISKHIIHSEQIQLPITIFQKIANYKQAKKNIIAVGTTMVRALETLGYLYLNLQNKNLEQKLQLNSKQKNFWEKTIKNLSPQYPIQNIKIKNDIVYLDTQLYIYPGFHFTIVDKIITNFHIPQSSLLIMISARMGRKQTLKSYQYALEHNYTFYSFGDGMLIQ